MSEKTSELIDFRGTLRKYLKNWYWFAISIVLCLLLGVLVILIQQPKYEVRAAVVLNEDNAVSDFVGGGMSGVTQIFGGNSSATDEVAILQSHSNLAAVALNQGLTNTLYERVMPLVKKQITKDKPLLVLPVESTILPDTLRTTISFNINLADKDNIKKLTVKAKGEKIFTAKNLTLPTTIKTDYGSFMIMTTPYFKEESPRKYLAKITSPDIAAENLRESKLNIAQANKNSSIIEMQMITADEDLAINILNDIIDVYNVRSNKEQKENTGATALVIADRVQTVRKSLSDTEDELARYKQQEGLGMLEADGLAMYERLGETEKLLTQQQAQTEMARIVIDLAKASEKDNSTIPPLTNIEALGTLINTYNAQVIRRMQLAASVKSDNAALQRLDEQIALIRATMIKNLEDAYESSKAMEDELRRVQTYADSQIKGLPRLENAFRQLARSQEIEEQVYIFLLQKQEEINILFNDNRPKANIVDRAYSTNEDMSMSKPVILLICLLMGVLIPPTVFYCRENLFSKKTEETEE